MQSVSLCDEVRVEEKFGSEHSFEFSTNGDFEIKGKTLEERAAEAFFAETGIPMPCLKVSVKKMVPAYAGLGGGSADVAALLTSLKARWCPQMPDQRLEEIGAMVGSDMPFCIRGGTALSTGRGEILTDMPSMPDCGLVICRPDFGIPTGELFAKVDERERQLIHPQTEKAIRCLQENDLRGLASCLGNVFEQVLPEAAKDVIDRIKQELLESGAMASSMSGSGSAVFGIFDSEVAARQACREMKYRGWKTVFACRPVVRGKHLEAIP